MTLGKPVVFKCPSCGERQQSGTLRSGNNIGARYYSDGKCIAPRLPEFPFFVKCPGCKVFFKRVNVNVRIFKCGMIPRAEFLTVNGYIQAIEEGLFNGDKDDIILLRLALWRAFNDFTRDRKKGEIEQQEIYESNCRAILSEISTETDNDETRLICAEIWRNIGEYEKCKGVLKEIVKKDKFESYISAISIECDRQNRFTVLINWRR